MSTLAKIDDIVQLRLRNTVGSPLDQTTRVKIYNSVLDDLQIKSNWNYTKQINNFDYLNNESDYSIENNLGITDFKQSKSLRYVKSSAARQLQKFEDIEEADFAVMLGQNQKDDVYTIEERNNDNILRILSRFGGLNTIVHEMDSLTSNGTWVSDSASDALTLELDTNTVKVGSGSLKFNIDVSQSVNNFSRIYTSVAPSSIDGSGIENVGHFRLWEGLQSLTSAQLALITSITFVWGSDASGTTPATKANYWSKTTTTNITGGSFQDTWNRVDFDWETATKTGSPDASDLKYFEIQINYSASMTDANNVRIDQIKMFDPQEVEFVYFSENMVDKSGTRQARFTTATVNTAETLLMPQNHDNMFVELALEKLFRMKDVGSVDSKDSKIEGEKLLQLAILKDGNDITREKYEFGVKGASSGREDLGGGQW